MTEHLVAPKIESLIEQMTLEEKIGQMTQVRHFADIEEEEIATRFIGSVIHTEGEVPGETAVEWQEKFRRLQEIARSTRLGIPLLFGVDAVHGQNTYEGATIFPHNIGMGAAANAELVRRAAEITALESRATGFNWVFSPCVAIPYNERWGRVYEAYSESRELTETLARASVLGHQGEHLGPQGVMATAKHFIGDGATDFGKEGGETSLSVIEVKKHLLGPYRAAIESGVGSVMVSFNTLEGIPMHAHKGMITGLLKEAMGFEGIVVSDWKGYSKYGEHDIINAGVDVVMAVDGDLDLFQEGLKKAVIDRTVPMDRIDDAVRRILRQKFRLGVFENPFPDPSLIRVIGQQAHREVARQAVRESLVLLKNEGRTLPLSKDLDKIVVVGAHADDAGLQSGGWTISWQGAPGPYKGATTLLDGIRNHARGEVIYDPDGTGKHPDADVVLICVGELPYAEFFGDVGHDTGDFELTLPEAQRRYLASYARSDAKVVVVLITGRPLLVTEEIGASDAFVTAWLPGSEGAAVAEVLFGDFNFKGSLPHSWPRSAGDLSGKFGPNFWDSGADPLFPMGFGLRYGAL
ncbi:MAG: glycoside hydrolase family 3 N-terminal domain-containing protein [Robiginitalea sp.]|nr:glycoside hydrolase family 3 N-terminal domain-containing protein [Robiginitalea sp.]